MQDFRKVVGLGELRDDYGPALKESGLEYISVGKASEALSEKADCILIDSRMKDSHRGLSELQSHTKAPILSFVGHDIDREELVQLKKKGVHGYISENTPAEEVAIRIRALLNEGPRLRSNREIRAARRVWFQQEVDFAIFKQSHKAWSTTLSETGMFLRTSLSFPLYSVIHLKFQLLGEHNPFECDGVIVRQEVEGDIRGIGVMFQNLKGENVRILESFLEVYR